MPPAALDASAPGMPRSSTATFAPACTRRRATDEPWIPAPMTATSTRMRRRDYAAATKRQEPRIRWQLLPSTRAGLRPFLSSNLDLPALLAELARLGVHLLRHFLGDLQQKCGPHIEQKCACCAPRRGASGRGSRAQWWDRAR